ncbi:uncharacterized protein PAC_11446 [Phialocephala subalpina]|uniref:Uncharacterized protein n=1 Tax=Phialocephala subalpina TaxID=576137 RepID=A0A1L7X949_9HELO|nr:uncharacterized protein PAC_11446 [Phialocephala subalpina]
MQEARIVVVGVLLSLVLRLQIPDDLTPNSRSHVHFHLFALKYHSFGIVDDTEVPLSLPCSSGHSAGIAPFNSSETDAKSLGLSYDASRRSSPTASIAKSSRSEPASRYHHYVPQFILRNFAHAYRPKGKLDRDPNPGINRGEKVVHGINLANAKAEFTESKVAKTFGVQDLFLDVRHPSNQQHVEEMFGKLEENALRSKTLFENDYAGGDKQQLKGYMRRKGFMKPIEVWLDDIQAFLEINMDINSGWQDELSKRRILRMLRVSTKALRLQLLTERRVIWYQVSIPNNHVFAHISPKLTMILRSNFLPIPVEDVQPDAKFLRDMMRKMAMELHDSPETATSFLADLPTTKPHNSYTQYLNGAPVPVSAMPIFSPSDVFYFRFFPLPSEQVGKINVVFLEEAHNNSIIAFKSKASLLRTVEFYLHFEEPDQMRHFKVARSYKLVKTTFGRSAKFKIAKEEIVTVILGNVSDQIQNLISSDPAMIAIYSKLSRTLLKLRIKLDTWTKRLDECIREKSRQNLQDFYCQLPPPRIWIYLKRVRFMFKDGTILGPGGEFIDKRLPREHLHGPEDAVANMWEIFLPGRFPHVMYYATTNHHHLTNPDFRLKGELTLDDDGLKRINQDRALAFGPQGRWNSRDRCAGVENADFFSSPQAVSAIVARKA